MSFEGLEVGYDIPAKPGMPVEQVQTPALIVDLDVFEGNLQRMGAFASGAGVRLRPHAKTHRSADIALKQMEIGGAVGVCCQKVSEAEALVRGGVGDVLVTNEVRDRVKVERLARLPLKGARVGVCLDDPAAASSLGEMAVRHGTQLDAYVEVDIGAGRCGTTPQGAVAVAEAISGSAGLRFGGVQAYQGSMQHVAEHGARRAAFEAACSVTREAVAALETAGFVVECVTGAGTGTFEFEADSGVYTELQAGSYIFMDADYAKVRDAGGKGIGAQWHHSLFVLSQIMSAAPGRAICDAGLKAHSVDSGLPLVWQMEGVTFESASDEHGTLADPSGRLKVGDKLWLVPGHCDPTCNLYDWYVGMRGGGVETLWPVTARGKGY